MGDCDDVPQHTTLPTIVFRGKYADERGARYVAQTSGACPRSGSTGGHSPEHDTALMVECFDECSVDDEVADGDFGEAYHSSPCGYLEVGDDCGSEDLYAEFYEEPDVLDVFSVKDEFARSEGLLSVGSHGVHALGKVRRLKQQQSFFVELLRPGIQVVREECVCPADLSGFPLNLDGVPFVPGVPATRNVVSHFTVAGAVMWKLSGGGVLVGSCSVAESTVMRGSVAACATASFESFFATKYPRCALTRSIFFEKTMSSFLFTGFFQSLHSKMKVDSYPFAAPTVTKMSISCLTPAIFTILRRST